MSAAVVCALHYWKEVVSYVDAKAQSRNSAHFCRVQEQIGNAPSVDVVILVGDVGENDTIRDAFAGPLERCRFEMSFSRRWETQQPQDRVWVLLKDVEPDTEDERIDLRMWRGSAESSPRRASTHLV